MHIGFSIPRALAGFFVYSLWSVSGQVLTLENVLAIADEKHPRLQAMTAQSSAATAGITTAKAYPNPEAGAMAGRQTFRVPGNVSGLVQSYSVSQPLELGGLRPARIAVAQRTVESANNAFRATRLDVLSGVRRAFHEVLRRQNEITILEENLRLVDELRKRIAVRVKVGEAGRLELVRADAEVTTAKSAANRAKLQLLSALAQLRAAAGVETPLAGTITGALDPPVVLGPLEEIQRESLQNHPVLALFASEVRTAEARLKYEEALRRPQPALRTEVEYPPDVPIYRAGISINLPLWNRREGPIAEASARVRQTRFLEQSRRNEHLAAVDGAYGRYQLASEQLAAFESGILAEAQEAVRAAETAYQLGERGVLEVLDAQRVLRAVRVDLLNSQFDRQAALIDLDELRGREPGINRP
jgi:outer membrane protein, heavy metal efflux system